MRTEALAIARGGGFEGYFKDAYQQKSSYYIVNHVVRIDSTFGLYFIAP